MEFGIVTTKRTVYEREAFVIYCLEGQKNQVWLYCCKQMHDKAHMYLTMYIHAVVSKAKKTYLFMDLLQFRSKKTKSIHQIPELQTLKCEVGWKLVLYESLNIQQCSQHWLSQP